MTNMAPCAMCNLEKGTRSWIVSPHPAHTWHTGLQEWRVRCEGLGSLAESLSVRLGAFRPAEYRSLGDTAVGLLDLARSPIGL
jgi:hypothetical protein